MSSSTSSSDRPADAASAWGRWLASFLGALAAGGALVLALVLIVDPYDSGRVGVLGIQGVSDESPRTANASRARDQQFDAAVIGNSTGQLLKPSELSRLTGSRFVQLTVPGTGVREQLAILDFFVRQHPRPGALVLVTDHDTWCTHDPALPMEHPFPFWLYGDSLTDYIGRLFSSRALGHTWRRVLIGLGLRKRSAPDGYWDYEALGPREFQPTISEQQGGAPAAAGPINDFFPGMPLLNTAIKALPADVPVVLVAPPTYYTRVPPPSSAGGRVVAACNAALQRTIAGRPRSNFINYRVDNALTRDRANFMDFGHYRAKIARAMERGIAESIRLGETAKIDF
jgi:hypothetical protein